MTTSPRDDLCARVLRIEEAHAFAEHAIEQLSAEIAMLNRRLAEAQTHIQRLESRINRLSEPADEGEEGAASDG